MPKLTSVGVPKQNPSKSSIYLDADTADIVRRVATAEGRQLTNVVNDMLVLYLRKTHPKWKLTFKLPSAKS